MKRITILVVVFLLAGNAFAEFSKVGSAGAQFLKIGVGSKYQAMGDASVAVANDVYAAYWNPAGLSDIENSAVSFTNVNWVLDVNLNYETDWVMEAELVGCNAPSGFLRYLFNEGSFQFDLFTGAGQLYLRLANGYIDFMSSTVGGVSNPGGGSDHLAITSGADNIRSGDHTVRVEYLRSLGRCRMWWVRR